MLVIKHNNALLNVIVVHVTSLVTMQKIYHFRHYLSLVVSEVKITRIPVFLFFNNCCSVFCGIALENVFHSKCYVTTFATHVLGMGWEWE